MHAHLYLSACAHTYEWRKWWHQAVGLTGGTPFRLLIQNLKFVCLKNNNIVHVSCSLGLYWTTSTLTLKMVSRTKGTAEASINILWYFQIHVWDNLTVGTHWGCGSKVNFEGQGTACTNFSKHPVVFPSTCSPACCGYTWAFDCRKKKMGDQVAKFIWGPHAGSKLQ